MGERHRQCLRKLICSRQNANYRKIVAEPRELLRFPCRIKISIHGEVLQIRVTRAQFAVTYLPVDGPVQFIEVQELVETPDAAFGDFPRVVDIEAVDRRIKSRICSTSCSMPPLKSPTHMRLAYPAGINTLSRLSSILYFTCSFYIFHFPSFGLHSKFNIQH